MVRGSTKERPLTVTALGWLLVVAGMAGMAFHASEIRQENVLHGDTIWVFTLELIPILAGIFVLRGRNWGRWLALAWMAFHVGISLLHSWQELLVHLVLLALIGYIFFRPKAGAYFRRSEMALPRP
jgi:hypothetical protein